ncbi:MAG TPA: hypothetical protein VMF87_06815 [Streptosporangiaceae bacterium]|nr:hypothetical protein [Streptosporangiaceae bacterium]
MAVFSPTAVAAAAPEAELPPGVAVLPAGVLLLLVGVVLAGALLDELLDELHAARAASPAAAAGTASSARRRRLGIFSLSCDVRMSFPRFSSFRRLSLCVAASPPVLYQAYPGHLR